MAATGRAIAEELRETVREAARRLDRVTPVASLQPLEPGKWTRREMLGHLIDSASNNHQRFVHTRGTRELVFEGYDQDVWVTMQGYAEAPWEELLALWLHFNRHLARVIESTPQEDLVRPRAEHNLDRIAWETVSRTEPATLAYFMQDYVGHLRHHLEQMGVGPSASR